MNANPMNRSRWLIEVQMMRVSAQNPVIFRIMERVELSSIAVQANQGMLALSGDLILKSSAYKCRKDSL